MTPVELPVFFAATWVGPYPDSGIGIDLFVWGILSVIFAGWFANLLFSRNDSLTYFTVEFVCNKPDGPDLEDYLPVIYSGKKRHEPVRVISRESGWRWPMRPNMIGPPVSPHADGEVGVYYILSEEIAYTKD